MTYCSGNTYCCLRGQHIGRPIRIAARTPWHIVLAIHIAAFEANISVDHYLVQCLRRDILFWRIILLPFRQMYRSTNTYFCDYAMTCYSGNMYWRLRDRRIGRPMRIATLSWHIIPAIRIDVYGASVSVDQYVLHRLRHDILWWKYILLPSGQMHRSTNTYCSAYAMTYCSGNTYCCLRDKRIGRPIRIATLTPRYIGLGIHTAAYKANVSVDWYVWHRLRHDLFLCQYILLPLR